MERTLILGILNDLFIVMSERNDTKDCWKYTNFTDHRK